MANPIMNWILSKNNHSYYHAPSKLINPLSEAIENKKSEFKSLTESIINLKIEIEKSRNELKKINGDSEIEYGSRTNIEERSWLGGSYVGRIFGAQTHWQYSFPCSFVPDLKSTFYNVDCIPINSIELSCIIDKSSKLVLKKELLKKMRKCDVLGNLSVVVPDASSESDIQDKIIVTIQANSKDQRKTGTFLINNKIYRKG